MSRLLLAAAAFFAPPARALHPRPAASDTASWARWLVHESDYGIISTIHDGAPFGNVISISDGNGYEHSTGVVYTYIASLDTTYKDVVVDSRVSVSWSEKALEGGESGGCKDSTAEDPPCGRLTISGRLTRVPDENRSQALEYLLSRHPVMEDWPGVHGFIPFWLHPDNITDFFVINTYGGAEHIAVSEYLAARWQREDPPDGSMECQRCGYVYDPFDDLPAWAEKGNGAPFDDLPDDWRCPICGSPKSLFREYDHGSPDGPADGPGGDETANNALVLAWAILSTLLLVAVLATGAVVLRKKRPAVDARDASVSQSLQPRSAGEEGA